jgi:hypothetical protein
MTQHVKDIAARFGALSVGIVALDGDRDRPTAVPAEAKFAIVVVVAAEQDPEVNPGIGGQVPVQNGLLASFILAAFCREFGYFATMQAGTTTERAEFAIRCGLGAVDRRGRLAVRPHGTKVIVSDVVFTDLPLARTG